MSPPDYNMALVYHAIHLELSDRIGYLAMKSRALNCLGKIYTALKDNEAAILLLVECLEVHSQTGNHRGLGIAYGNIGTVYRAMGPDGHSKVYDATSSSNNDNAASINHIVVFLQRPRSEGDPSVPHPQH
ncbi:uncharacterized protein LOC117291481 [Asterias rubens]|uniref:uncharacterized protein LOC117291481 n=1 Tax=Asterias rubens TaxID=7604 RepID=UPI001454EFF3|nr:uncharacterized protein LOC117291481 [Asterias rubens]